MDRKRASLFSASIGNGFNSKVLRQKLRNFADSWNLEILNEWTDIEKWYSFDSYQKDNIYVIGGAASFTDKTYGFGLKYSILSAKLCAKAISEDRDYNRLLNPVLKELHFWERMGNVLTKTTNSQQDAFIRLAQNPLVKWKIESGGSLRPYFRLLSGYFKMKNMKNKDYLPSPGVHTTKRIKLPTPER
jgi:flavin-dependent dehydrogenase